MSWNIAGNSFCCHGNNCCQAFSFFNHVTKGMFSFRSYREALRVLHQHSGISGIHSVHSLTLQDSFCLQCYCRASPLVIVQDQYEVVWHLQAIFSQILTPLQKGLRLDAGPKKHNLSPWGSGPAQRRKVPFCFTVLRSHHYNANLHCTFCLHIFHPPPVVTTQPS